MSFLAQSKPKNHDPIKKTRKYGRRKTKAVQIVYIASIVIWILLLWALSLYTTDFVGYCILAIPIIVYAIGYFNASTLTVEVEESVFSLTALSIAILIVLPILAWVNKDFGGDKQFLVRIMIVAIILEMLSLIDIWVRPKWLSVVRHIKSVLQTAALTLLVFALYTYYMGRLNHTNDSVKP